MIAIEKYMKEKIFTLLLILSLFLSSFPIPTFGVETLPPVPVSDWATRTKEVGITIFGLTVPGITLDGVMIKIVKKLLEDMSDATVEYINNGFRGPDGSNSPAFAVDPEGFLLGVADRIGGQFLSDIGGDVLCSSFRAQLQASLRLKVQAATSRSSDSPRSSCTISGAAGNVQNFFNGDFSAGGWQSWFEISQVPENNPIGAFLKLEGELNSKIQSATGIEQEKLAWANGFLSFDECVEKEFDQDGEVCRATVTRTPGKVIETQLQKTLGTEIAQLELADEFDEIVSALIGQLAGKVFTSSGGLFTSGNTPWARNGLGGRNPAGRAVPQCYANVQTSYVSDNTKVTWTLTDLVSQNPTYAWFGGPNPEDNLVGSGLSTTTIYRTPGLKTAGVTITDTFLTNGATTTTTQIVNCQPPVDVKQYLPITGKCFAVVPGTYTGPNTGTRRAFFTHNFIRGGDGAIAPHGGSFAVRLEWRVELDPNGGSGTIDQYLWSDTAVYNPSAIPGAPALPFGYRDYQIRDNPERNDVGNVAMSVRVVDRDPSVPIQRISCDEVDLIPPACARTFSCASGQ